MAHAIPKIHYAIAEVTGDTTNGNAVISNVSDTDDIEVGMYIAGTGIAAGATVLSKTSSTVTMTANATATNATVDLEFYKKIEFDYPPVEKTAEKLTPQERRSVALSGVTQVSIDHIEGVRNLNFNFLSSALFTALKSFFQTSAVYGDSFRYFDDKTLTDYVTYELKTFDWAPDKPTGRSTYDVPMQFRRVV
jgi:hypothetical protein